MKRPTADSNLPTMMSKTKKPSIMMKSILTSPFKFVDALFLYSECSNQAEVNAVYE